MDRFRAHLETLTFEMGTHKEDAQMLFAFKPRRRHADNKGTPAKLSLGSTEKQLRLRQDP
jgi:hypothetical protein